MLTRTSLLLLALLVALAVSAAACTDGDGPDGPAPTAGASPTAGGTPQTAGEALTIEEILEKDPGVTKREEIVWGYLFEESGILAGFGQPAGDGLELAVQEINAAGGFQVGDTVYTIRLEQRDSNSDVATTISLATELVRDEGITILWGPAAIGDQESTAITQQAGVLHLCPCPQRELTSLETVEAMREQGRYAFQTLAAPSRFLPPAARNARSEYPQFDTFATMCSNSVPGHTFCDFFKDAYEAAGFEHVAEVFFPSETTDFSPFLTTLKQDDPDIILNFVDAGPEQFQLLRRSWELDVGELYTGVELPYELFESLVGEGIRNKYVSAGAAPRGHAQYTSEAARAFFEDKYTPFVGGALPPAAFAALLTYDPVYMVIAAMQRAGSVDDIDAIAAALEQVHFSGAGEDDMYFDERHVIVTGNDACQIYQGQMTCQHYPPAE